MMEEEIATKAAQVIERARTRELRLATVESCTGGLVVAALTSIAGSSDVVEGGLVTYANCVKESFVHVPHALLEHYGAVSSQVAIAMAEGGIQASGADRVVAVTGIAGPGGGSAAKPVGLVHFAVACRHSLTQARKAHFNNLDRAGVRCAAVVFALDFLFECLN